jgi:hypothetical protein
MNLDNHVCVDNVPTLASTGGYTCEACGLWVNGSGPHRCCTVKPSPKQPEAGWLEHFDEKQRRLISVSCGFWRSQGKPPSMPSQPLLVIVAKMADLLMEGGEHVSL